MTLPKVLLFPTLLAALLAVVPATALFAQKAKKPLFRLSGQVTDATTKEPLVGVTVSIEGGNKILRTDTAGLYGMLLPTGRYTIGFSYVGYAAKSTLIEIKQDTRFDFSLENYDNQLDEVVVTGRQGETNVETPSLGVSILSLKSIQKLPAAAGEVDIIRSLQTLPGISSVGEGSNGVNIRGGNVDQNVIYFDDMPILNPTHMFGLFSVFATDAIREFQIYKGSIPAKYGGRTASILDVKMVNPSTEKFKMNGGAGLVSNRLTLEIPLIKDKLSVMSSGRLSYNNYVIELYNKLLAGTFSNGKPLPDNNANFYDLANKVYYRPNDRNVLSFSNYFSRDNYEVDSLFGLQNLVADRTYFQYGHRNYALNWSYFFTPEFVVNTVAVSSRYTSKTEIRDTNNQVRLNTDFLYRQLKSELVYARAGKHRLSAGLSGIQYTLQPGNLNPFGIAEDITPVNLAPEQSLELAAFAAEEYTVSSRFLVELGLRYAHYRNLGPLQQPLYVEGVPRTEDSVGDTLSIGKNETESSYGGLEPRVALRYKLGEASSVKFGYNRSQQFIQLLSNNTTPLPTARWKTANRYIKPQRSDFVSAGWFHDAPKSFWEYSVEAYYRRIDGVLDFVNSANLQINPLVETQLLDGRGKSYGLELMVAKKRGVMTGWLNYTWSRALQQIRGDLPEQNINDGEWFPSYIDKPHTVNCLVNLKADDHNSFSFTFTYSTGRPFTAPVGVFINRFNFVPIYDERNNSRISDYHRLDFSWTISNPSLKQKRWQSDWVFSVYNLYARKNAYSYFFKPTPSGVQAVKLSIFPAPIISLSYNFRFQ